MIRAGDAGAGSRIVGLRRLPAITMSRIAIMNRVNTLAAVEIKVVA